MELMNDIEKYIEANKSSIVRDIARLVAVDSVEGSPEEGAPFGRGPAKAMETALEIACELGLETENYEDRICCARIGAKDGKYLATITHLDVVPVGEGWTGDPFKLRERDGYLIGRGVMDDKGPAVICLYALRYLKEKGMELPYGIRALMGLNEETGMKDVEYYLENYPAPVFCLSPDANFPICNGEKGICQGRITGTFEAQNIVALRGGVAMNAIPGKSEAWLRCRIPEASADVSVEVENGLVHLTASGISGHASIPQGTRNANGVLVDFILENQLAGEEEEKFLRKLSLLHHDYSGKTLGIDADDGLFAPLTVIGSVISVEDGKLVQCYDCRYPTNTDAETIRKGIESAFEGLAEVSVGHNAVPFYISVDNPAIQVCLEAYNTVTGEEAKPFTMGGGTYARDFPNGVAFGPEHPERPQPDFAGPIHGADEAACLDYFLEALKIYILALINLEKLSF